MGGHERAMGYIGMIHLAGVSRWAGMSLWLGVGAGEQGSEA